MNKNLILDILKSKKNNLISEFGIIDLALFGSYAKGENKENSDIDILIDMNNEYRTFDNYMNLKFYFEDLFDKPVDLALKNKIRKEFRDIILKEAIYA